MIGAPAGLVARFDDRGRDPRRLEPDRERKPAESGADNDGPSRHSQSKLPIALIARPIGTGGRPDKSRNRSAPLDAPA